MAAALNEGPVCIVYTGQSGTGKSTLIGTLDGFTKGKAGAKSDTVGSHMSVDSVTGDKLMDTQGVMDSSGKVSDGAITAAVVKAMKDNGVTQVKIVWTMRKSRMSPALQAVAKFIHSLGEPVGALRDLKDWKPVDIWKSVMIIVAEGTGKKHGFGAIAAAKEAMENSSYDYGYHGQEKTIPVFCLSILDELDDDCILKEAALEMERGKRMDKGLLNMSEIGEWQRGLISKLIRPSKVVFEDVRCDQCGLEGDPRALSPDCHVEFKHKGALVPVMKPYYRTKWSHSGRIVISEGRKHSRKWVEAGFGEKFINVFNPMIIHFQQYRKEVYGYYPCCGSQDENSDCPKASGPTAKWSCCGYDDDDSGCESEQVYAGQEHSHSKYNGCNCREGANLDDCAGRICKICEGVYGSNRSKTARCDGKHKFV